MLFGEFIVSLREQSRQTHIELYVALITFHLYRGSTLLFAVRFVGSTRPRRTKSLKAFTKVCFIFKVSNELKFEKLKTRSDFSNFSITEFQLLD